MDTVVLNATAGEDVVVVFGDAGGVSVLGLAARIDVVGFEARDRLVINTLAGDDVVEALGLAAVLSLTADGGAGDDVLIGGDGADVLLGGVGNAVLDGGAGDNVASQGASALGPSATDAVF